MATSSITKNFVISGKEAVESFIDALETSFNMEVPERPSCGRDVTDSEEAWSILRRAAARKRRHHE
ncbi:MAG: hypothetical protein IJU98_07100 [Synergistaceae bacterium]|nr:hypothetical protein [Synergistaceae bacterium]